MKPCPTCNGKQNITTPNGTLWQICPTCQGTGEDPGIELGYFAYKSTIVLTASQVLLSQKVTMNGQADFRVKLLTKKSTGTFRIRLQAPTGNYMSAADVAANTNDRIPDQCLFGDGSLPFVMAPHPRYHRSGFIGFDIEDTSGAGNTVELVFHGANLG